MGFVFAGVIYFFAYPMHFINQTLKRGCQLSDLLPQFLNLFTVLLRLVSQKQHLLDGLVELLPHGFRLPSTSTGFRASPPSAARSLPGRDPSFHSPASSPRASD